MRIRPGVILAVVAVLGLLFGGRYFGWFGGRQSATQEPTRPDAGSQESSPTVVMTSPAPPPAPVRKPTPRPAPARPANPGTVAVPAAAPAATPAPAATQLITDWEQRIDNILTTEGDEAVKAGQLLQMLPFLPEDGQIEAAQHLSNLLADEDFASLAPLLTNAALPEDVLDVFLTDVLNRPNNLKLPALLEMARVPNHPKAEEALDILEIYVDENYGQNWGEWDAAVRRWLQENPE